MPLKRIKRLFFGPGPRVPKDLALKVYRRDHFKCQYCGLDGRNHFENWLILTVDYIHPFARGGSHHIENLVTACQPCNVLKGTHDFKTLEAAKAHVQRKREEWRQAYAEQTKG